MNGYGYGMTVAGAIGGLMGTHMVLGEANRLIDGEIHLSGHAWTGLLVSLLAANNPIGVLLAGLAFSGLQVGGLAMQRSTEVSWRLAQVLQAVVIIAIASRFRLQRRSPPDRTRDPTDADPGDDRAAAEPTTAGQVSRV